MKTKLRAIGLVAVLSLFTGLYAQTNVGLLATSTHSGGGASASGYGPELYNDGVIPATTGGPAFTWGWVSTNGWIEYTWSSPQTFNRIVLYKDNRPMSTCVFQYWDAGTNNYVNFYNYNSTAIVDSVDFTPITTTRFRMNSIAGSSNPNHREIQVILTKQGVDNAGISGLSEPKNFCPGTHDVKVEIQNLGNNQIDSVRVNWELDGVFQGTVYHRNVLDTVGGTGNNSAVVTLGSLSFPSGVTRNVKVWTSHPNGQVDQYNQNDTMSFALKPALSGTFTIGGTGADYASVADAADDLSANGVCGPVTFMVAPGTYTGQVILGEINGASSTNTIQFIGSGVGSTIISHTGTSTANMVTVMLNGADHVTFRDMTIRNLGGTNAVAIMFTGQADYNSFRNVSAEVPTTVTGSLVTCVVWNGSTTTVTTYGNTGNYNVLDSCTVIGGYYGIRMNGGSTSQYIKGNQITNTRVERAYYYSAYLYYVDEVKVENCYFDFPRNTTNYAMYAYYISNSELNNNTFLAQTYGLYSLYFNQNHYNSSIVSQIANNRFVANANYGVYFSSSSQYRFVHNSVSASAAYAVYAPSGSNVTYINNHIQNTRTSANSYAFYCNAGLDTLNYNNYWSLGTGSFIYVSGADYNDWGVYQSAMATLGYDQNSFNQDPQFVSNQDLSINQNTENLRGIYAGLDVDGDGDSRCIFSPSLGADESEYPTVSPDAVIAMQDTVYESSPITFFSAFAPSAGSVLDYTWYIDNVQVGKTRNYTHTFTSMGQNAVKLRVRSCGADAYDSLTFTVVAPTRVPESGFTANRVIANVLEEVSFNDLTLYGPTTWEWTIEPSTDATFDDPSSPNPKAFFFYPGEYEVCLTTWNALGQGNKICKRSYISINDDQMLCAANTSSSMAAGRLTDEGGIFGNYSANSNCNFLIEPCATEVTLRFTEWTLADADDYIRIYDGKNRNAPLIGTYDINTVLPGGSSGIRANSGSMYIEWVTSGAGQSSGFVAFWSSTPDTNVTPPVADFDYPSPAYIDQQVFFTDASSGVNMRYSWDFNPPMLEPGLDGGNGSTDRYIWSTPGTYPVFLTVRNCGGVDTITQYVDVITPTSAPVPGFVADRERVPVLSSVTFQDTSLQGPTAWKWRVSPAITTNIQGPDDQPVMKAAFLRSGLYTVKLIVSNSIGEDSIAKVDFIEVFDYCSPVVGNLSGDVGISRVAYGDVSNYSNIGESGYTNYVPDIALPPTFALRSEFEITLERQTTIDPMNRKVWIDWNNDGDFQDSLEQVAYEPSARTRTFATMVQVPDFAAIGYTTMRVGTSYSTDQNRPCGINPTGEFEDYPVRIVRDANAPVITLNGSDVITIEQGYQYTELGATAMDNLDGNLTSMIVLTSNVDTSVAGTYQVRYNVTDVDGNAATEVVRTVIVTPDVTAPVITLNGSNPVDVTIATSYTDAGATATDYFNIDLTPTMTFGDNVDINTVGTYHYWYVVSDASGNRDSVAREVNVLDNVAPVITLTGSDTLFIEVFGDINEPGYSVSDNYDASVTVTIDSSTVNKSVVGTYPMTYSSTDLSGNTGSVIRYVVVEDKTAPVISLTAGDTVLVDVFSLYSEQGATVSDNYCSSTSWQVSGSIDTDVLGDYPLTYTATDCNGNQAVPAIRVVRVVDRQAPVVTLNGFAAQTMVRWETFNDPGVSITDNYYDETTLQGMVDITTNFDPNWVGLYSICYSVTDPSGNTSYAVCRTIHVQDNTSSLDNVSDIQIRAYPNPSRGIVTIESEALVGGETIVVRDMSGKEVATFNLSGVGFAEINLSNMSEGMYFLHVTGNQLNKVIKIQIENK